MYALFRGSPQQEGRTCYEGRGPTLILPYPPRQGSHRWAIHDTATTIHGANWAFTMPRYICTAPSAYQTASSAQVRHPCLCRACALGLGSGNQRRSCQLSCDTLCAPLLSCRQKPGLFCTDGRSASTGTYLFKSSRFAGLVLLPLLFPVYKPNIVSSGRVS